jgi:hypothetical protein
MDSEKLISEARARIIWGESSSAVREFLISNGISAAVADARIAEFNLERNREIRSIGVRSVLIGSTLIIATGIAVVVMYPFEFTSGFVKSLGLVLLAGIYGIWKLATGIVHLVRPKSESRSVPNIQGSDILD